MLESTLQLNISNYLAQIDKAVAVARAAEPLLSVNAQLGGQSGAGGLDAATRDLERYTAAQTEAQTASASLRQEQVASTAATASQAETENTATQSVARGAAARLAAAQSEAEFRQQRLASNLAASEAVARNSDLQRSTEELTAAEREAMNANRAPVGALGQDPGLLASRRAEQEALKEEMAAYPELAAAMRIVTPQVDDVGRALRVTSQELKNGTTAVTAMVAGYNGAGEKILVAARAEGTLESATKAASVSAIAQADALGLEAAAAETSSGSMFRLGGSVNDSGNAHLRLMGPLGLAAAGIAIVGAAALKEAADLETARVRTENFGSATAVVGQQLQDTLNHSFGTGTNSAADFMKALAPVSGILAQVEGGELQVAQTAQVASAAQQLQVLTGEKLDATTKAIVETLRTYKLGTSEAATVEAVLYDAHIKTGESIESIAQKYGLLHTQLGTLNPTLADATELIKDSAAAGSDSNRVINTMTSGITVFLSETQKEHDALQKYGIQIQDTTGKHLSLKTILEETARATRGKSDADVDLMLKELGVQNAGKDEIDMLRIMEGKLRDGTFETQNLQKAQQDLEKQVDTTAVAMDRLKAKAGDVASAFGTVVATGILEVANSLNAVVKAVEALSKLDIPGWLKVLALGATGAQMAPGPGGSVLGAAGGVASPVHGNFPITQGFGPTDEALEPSYGGYPHFHQGIDIGAPGGTSVYAAAAGKIDSIDLQEGKITETTEGGLTLIYQHNKPIMVKVGEHVGAGQEIAKVGEGIVGTSTGPHEHFGVFSGGVPIDPTAFLGSMAAGGTAAGVAGGAGPLVPGGLPVSTMQGLAAKAGFSGNDLATIVAIAARESIGGKPDTGEDYLHSGHMGMFQISRELQKQFGVTGMESPDVQFQTAHRIFEQYGFTPWRNYQGNVPTSPETVLHARGTPITQEYPGLSLIGTTTSASDVPRGGVVPATTGGTSDPYGNVRTDPTQVANAQRTAEQSINSLAQTTERANALMGASSRRVTDQTIADDQARIASLTIQVQAHKPLVDSLVAQEKTAADAGNVTLAQQIHDKAAPAMQAYTEVVQRLGTAQTQLKTDQDELNSSTQAVAQNTLGYSRTYEEAMRLLGQSSRTVTDQTIADDQAAIDSAKARVAATGQAAHDIDERAAAAQAAGDIPGFKELQSQAGPTGTEFQNATAELSKAMGQLKTDQDLLRANTKELGTAWEAYGQTTIKVLKDVDDQNTLVTQDMLNADEARVSSARDAANAQGNIVYGLLQELSAATERGNQVEIDDLKERVAVEQKIYNDDATNYGAAQTEKSNHLKRFEAEQRAAADATRAFAQEEIANNQLLVTSLQAAGLQIPDMFKTGLESAKTAVGEIHNTIQTLNSILQIKNLDPGDRAAFEQERKDQETKLSDAKATFSAELEASKQYSQGEELLSKARLDQAKADRAADLTDVREKNAEKLASDLAAIQAGEEAQLASLGTSSEVLRIQAETYRAQAAAATDSVSRQRADLQAQLAEQTAAIQDNEARQIQAVRDGEQQKLKQYNDILLQYQEAAQTSAAMQLQIQVDLDTAKADADIALSRIQQKLIVDQQQNVQVASDAEIQSLNDYLSNVLPKYRQGVNDAAVAWENYGTTVAAGLIKAQNAISGLTQSSDQQVSKIQSATQNQLALLQAHNQAQSAGVGLAANDPQTQALQRQIDQLQVVKNQQDLNELGAKQQLAALQAQNGVLTAQLTLLRDQQQVSAAYLANTSAIANVSLQRDQAELALLNATSEAQQAKLAELKEQLDVLNSQNAVLQAQVQLQADLAVASDAYLSISTQLKTLAVQNDQAQIDLLNAMTAAQQGLLDAEKERLVVLNSQVAVLSAQAAFLTDQVLASDAYLNTSTQLKALAVERDQAEVSLLQQQNAAAQVQLVIEKQQLDAEQAKLAVLEAELKLSQDQAKASPQFLALTAQLNQLHVAQDALAVVGRHNTALDSAVTMLEAQQKLLISQNTAENTSLEAQKSIEQVQIDQLQLQQAQTNLLTVAVTQQQSLIAAIDQQITLLQAQQQLIVAQGTLASDQISRLQAQYKVQTDQYSLLIAQQSVVTNTVARLTQQAEVLDRQIAQLQAQQKLMQDQTTLAGDTLSKEQAKAKVETDQLTLQNAQAGVITKQQATLTLQVAALDRQLAQLQAQQKILTDQNTLALQQLTQEEAIAKVQVDQLQVQQAQMAAQNAITTGVTATLAQLQAELTLRQSILKVQQTVTPTTTGGAGGTTGSFGATPTQTTTAAANQYPLGSQYNPLPSSVVPSTQYTQYGDLVTSGQYKGWVITNHINVTIGNKTISEAVLTNFATGQTLDVAIA